MICAEIANPTGIEYDQRLIACIGLGGTEESRDFEGLTAAGIETGSLSRG